MKFKQVLILGVGMLLTASSIALASSENFDKKASATTTDANAGFLIKAYAVRVKKDPTKDYSYTFSLSNGSTSLYTKSDSGKNCLNRVEGKYNADTTYTVSVDEFRGGTQLCEFSSLSLPSYKFDLNGNGATCTFSYFIEVFYKGSVIYQSSTKDSKNTIAVGSGRQKSWSGNLNDLIGHVSVSLDTTLADNHSSCSDITFTAAKNYSLPAVFGNTYDDGTQINNVLPLKENASFAGYWNENGTTKYFDELLQPQNIALTESVILKSFFSNKVILYSNGGSGIDNEYSYLLTIGMSLPVPSKNGYSFDGWFDNESLEGDAFTSILPTDSGDKVFYAKWSMENYSIEYELNGGLVEIPNPTSYNIESLDIILNNPSRDGYKFVGWTTDEMSTPVMEMFIPTGSTGNKKFIANWEAISYSITYELNGGTVSGNPTTYTIDTPDIVLINPTKTGYSFIGWTGTNIDEPTTLVVINQGSTEDRHYVANFEMALYTITYDLAGGEETIPNPTLYTYESETFTLNYPQKDHCVFAGWIGTGLSEPTMNVTIRRHSEGNRTYTATWNSEKVLVTFETGEGGSIVPQQEIEYNTKATIPSEPNKVVDGIRYKFVYWFMIVEEQEVEFDFNNDIKESITLFAKWSSFVDEFVKNYMHPEILPSDQGTGMCISERWYADAKAVFNTLTTEEKTLFLNDDVYSEFAKRLLSWAAANGDEYNGITLGTSLMATSLFSTEASSIVIIILVGCISMAIMGSICISKKHRKSHK